MSVQSSLSALYWEREVEKGVFVERRGAAIAGARPFSQPPSFHIQERKGLSTISAPAKPVASQKAEDGGRTSVILFDCNCLFR